VNRNGHEAKHIPLNSLPFLNKQKVSLVESSELTVSEKRDKKVGIPFHRHLHVNSFIYLGKPDISRISNCIKKN